MSELLEWLNRNSGAVNSLLTLLLIVVTAAYVFLTRRLVLESAALREAASRPVLSIVPVLHEAHVNIINLLIENLGGGSAHHVRLRTRRPFMIEREDPLAEVGPFKKGLSYFAPKQRLELFLANAVGQDLEELIKEPLEIEADYLDVRGRAYHNSFTIDFGEFENITRVGEPPIYTLADSLKKLAGDFSRLLSGMGRMRVLTYSVEDEAAEHAANKLWHKLRRLTAEDRSAVEEVVNAKLASAQSNTIRRADS